MRLSKAPRQEGTGAPTAPRAFSLIELLLAIFILGIGVISIAALFPAGIAQQRKTVDDVMGPLVANNAMELIRSKVRADYFGIGDYRPVLPEGDWLEWRRPALFLSDTTLSGGAFVPAGSISLFDDTLPNTSASELFWNSVQYAQPPQAIITQGERYFPMQSASPVVLNSGNPPVKPQYAWDCAFRLHQEKVLVAIFVYRVTIQGGSARPFIVPPNPVDSTFPFLPFFTPLAGALAWNAGDGAPPPFAIDGTDPCTDYDPYDVGQSWQDPGQWILDQNNNIHRVLSSYCDDASNPRAIELVRPVSQTPGAAISGYTSGGGFNNGIDSVVAGIWYMPSEFNIDFDGDGTPETPVSITPVYLAVKEL